MVKLLLSKQAVDIDSSGETGPLGSLMKELTAPSKLTISESGEKSQRVLSVLSALSALVECATGAFCSTKRSESVIRFCLETILLGRGTKKDTTEEDGDDDSDSDESDEHEEYVSKKTPKRKSISSKDANNSLQHKSPTAGGSLLENEDLSLACRRVCAAIEFLVSYIRSNILQSLSSNGTSSIQKPPDERIKSVFSLLLDMIRDQGLPPSSRDRKFCKARQERAAIRQCASVQLLRLCDSRLRIDGRILEQTYISFADFHVLAGNFLDEEKVVREAALDELSDLLLGEGVFKEKGPANAPRNRYLALVALATDGEHASGHSRANGGAANVGKKSTSTRLAASRCVALLRRTVDGMLSHLQAAGRGGDEEFENIKLQYLPEYAVPYCINLLCFRRETPVTVPSSTATGKRARRGDEKDAAKSLEQSQHKILRKRLKWLFDPLIQKQGNSADNLSFLHQMLTELADRVPICEASAPNVSSSSRRESLDTTISSPGSILEPEMSAEAEAKCKAVCSAARKLLVDNYLKKDSDISKHPGGVKLPESLFIRKKEPSKLETPVEKSIESDGKKRTSADSERKDALRSTDRLAPGSARSSRSVNFSPALPKASSSKSPLVLGVSPIAPQSSGRKSRNSEQETKTLSPGDGLDGLTTDDDAGDTPMSKHSLTGKFSKQPVFSSPVSSSGDAVSPLRHNTGLDDHVQTTSETQSPDSAGGSVHAEQKEEEEEDKKPAAKARRQKKTSAGGGVPTHIKIGRKKSCGGDKENIDNGGFTFDEDDETLMSSPRATTKKKTAAKKRKSPGGGLGNTNKRRGLRSQG